jgi:hypothetical protein
MNEIDYFKVFVLCSGDVTANVGHLHVKKFHLVGFSYIVIEDTLMIQSSLRKTILRVPEI